MISFLLFCLTFAIGFTVGIFIYAQMFLPILYSFPRSIYLYFKGQLRFIAIPLQFVAPIIWTIVLIVFGFLLASFAPSVLAFTQTNSGFLFGTWVSLPVLLFQSFISRKGRADMRADFDQANAKYFTESGKESGLMFGRSKDTKTIFNLEAYIVYLLLNEGILEDHRQKFLGYLAENKPLVKDAQDLSSRAFEAIQNIADELGEKGSLLAAHSMIWNFDRED